MLVCVCFHTAEGNMNEDTRKLMQKVAQKMGWVDEEALDAAEKKVCCTHQ